MKQLRVLWIGFILLLATVLSAEPIRIYFFSQTGCPNCQIMKDFVDDFIANDSAYLLDYRLINSDTAQFELFIQAAEALGIERPLVPMILVGGHYFVGSRVEVRENLAHVLAGYRSGSYSDYMGRLLAGELDEQALLELNTQESLHLPLLGTVVLEDLSLAVSTMLIAFVDGFNPCSLWVLTLVLGMSLQAGKRGRVLATGSLFLLVTSLVYGGFLFGAVKVVTILQFSSIFRVALILFVLLFAAVNIKDYFWWKTGFSFTISESGQKAFLSRLRKALNPSRGLLPLLAGTVLLAFLAALIELPCTAGFPVLWAQLIHRARPAAPALGLYLGLYLFVYLLIEIIVLTLAVISLKRQFINEEKGRILKLVSGSLMAVLALHLVFFNSLMHSAYGLLSLLIFTLLLIGLLTGLRRLLERRGGRQQAEKRPV